MLKEILEGLPQKIVFFRGNPSYGTSEMHSKLEKEVKQIVEKSGFIFEPHDSGSVVVPTTSAVCFIGFSRGTRYFKKIKGVKIGIGSFRGTYSFVNSGDKSRDGDLSEKSLKSHFTISSDTKKNLEKILVDMRR